jgi:hypothetical protein
MLGHRDLTALAKGLISLCTKSTWEKLTMTPSAAALYAPPPLSTSGTKNPYQAKSDFLPGPNGAPPKVVSIINLILPSWLEQLSKVQFHGDGVNFKVKKANCPTNKPTYDKAFSLPTANKGNRHTDILEPLT